VTCGSIIFLAHKHVIIFFKIGSCPNKKTMHFPTLNKRAKSVSFNAAKYANEVDILRKVQMQVPRLQKARNVFLNICITL
jgi:hypothetical protein